MDSIAMAATLAACTGKATEDREQADDTDTSTLTETDIAGDSETEAEGIISDFEEEDKNNGTDRGEDHTMKIYPDRKDRRGVTRETFGCPWRWRCDGDIFFRINDIWRAGR